MLPGASERARGWWPVEAGCVSLRKAYSQVLQHILSAAVWNMVAPMASVGELQNLHVQNIECKQRFMHLL